MHCCLLCSALDVRADTGRSGSSHPAPGGACGPTSCPKAPSSPGKLSMSWMTQACQSTGSQLTGSVMMTWMQQQTLLPAHQQRPLLLLPALQQQTLHLLPAQQQQTPQLPQILLAHHPQLCQLPRTDLVRYQAKGRKQLQQQKAASRWTGSLQVWMQISSCR